MPRTEIVEQVAAYLSNGAETNQIQYLNNVYPYPPKIVQGKDLMDHQEPGTNAGAVIFLYVGSQNEIRISTAGITGGRKAVSYVMSLICYFRSVGRKSEEAGLHCNYFIDALKKYIQADRTCGTSNQPNIPGNPPPIGPFGGTGLIFSWGEGPSPEYATPDLKINSALPRDFGGEIVQVFSIVEIHVVEIEDT